MPVNKQNFVRYCLCFCICLALIAVYAVLPGTSFPAEEAEGKAMGEVFPEIAASDDLGGGTLPEELTKPRPLYFSSYLMEPGDNISTLAQRFGLYQDTIISKNEDYITSRGSSKGIRYGEVLNIPNQDGIIYTVKSGDTLDTIADTYKDEGVTVDKLITVNELVSPSVTPGSSLFIPGARMDQTTVREINGDMFLWPVYGRLTSYYGYRRDPFTRASQYHNGLDIAAPSGMPVRAGMGGRVSFTGFNASYGNMVIIDHSSGYRTMYGHLSSIAVSSGQYVYTGQRIGSVGSTGRSTGPHLHFTVYKNRKEVNPMDFLR